MKKFCSFLAFLLPLIAQAGEYSSTLVVQTGHLRESDLVVRNITDLRSKKTCLAFYIRVAVGFGGGNCFGFARMERDT